MIACNTASALALDAIQDAVSVPVLGVIEPGAAAARAHRNRRRAGDRHRRHRAEPCLCGACQARGLRALEKACPLLVPLVEEGWTRPSCHGRSGSDLPRGTLAEAAAQGLNPDTLVLGCTHYPLLKPLHRAGDARGHEGDRFGRIHRRSWSCFFAMVGNPPRHRTIPGPIRCFATDSVEKFERLGSRFLGRPVGEVELVDLGG